MYEIDMRGNPYGHMSTRNYTVSHLKQNHELSWLKFTNPTTGSLEVLPQATI